MSGMSQPILRTALALAAVLLSAGCGRSPDVPTTPPAPQAPAQEQPPVITRGFNFGQRDAATFADAASWGATNARIHLRIPHDAPPGRYWQRFEETTLKEAEAAVAAAHGTGVKVVLTLGSFVPGADRDQHEYWAHPDLAELTIGAWRRLAQRLAPMRGDILGYDLLNEPLDRSVAPRAPVEWRELAIRTIAAIREHDRDTWVIFEPGPGGTFAGFFDLEPLPDARVMYSAHYYFPHQFTHQGIHNVKGTELTKALTTVGIPYPLAVGALGGDTWELAFHRLPDLAVFDRAAIARIAAPALAFQAKHRVPLYLGEFSAVRWAPHDDALRYLRDLIGFCEEHGWSWSYHGFREFNGWSLECGDGFDWVQGMPMPPQPAVLTDRARLVLDALAANRQPRRDVQAVEVRQAALGAPKRAEARP
jgi:endoglucanase